MSPSTGDVLRAVLPALGDALVSPNAFHAVRTAGDYLPLTDGGLECHLGSPDRVDLALRFERSTAFRGNTEFVLASSDSGGGSSLEHRVAAWLREDQGGNMPLSLWLEYDLNGTLLPDPSLFLGPGLCEQSAVPKLAQWSHDLDRLTSGGYVRSVSSSIEWMEQALPPGGFITYIGHMAESRGDLWRTVVAGVAPGSVANYLRNVSWPGPVHVLDAAVEIAHGAEGSLCLALDILPLPGEKVRIGPVLGLEFGVPSEAPRAQAQMQRLLSPAYDGAIIEALCRWPGITCRGDRHWPESLRPAAEGIVRRVNHLKLVYRDSVHPLYKAYLYFGLIGQEAL